MLPVSQETTSATPQTSATTGRPAIRGAIGTIPARQIAPPRLARADSADALDIAHDHLRDGRGNPGFRHRGLQVHP